MRERGLVMGNQNTKRYQLKVDPQERNGNPPQKGEIKSKKER